MRIESGTPSRRSGLAAAVLAALLGILLAAAPVRAMEGQRQAPPATDSAHEQKVVEAEEEERSSLEHVVDSSHIELFESFGLRSVSVVLFKYEMFGKEYEFPTKFMLLELIAAALVVGFYVPLAWRLQSGELPSGWTDNVREVLLTFVREDIAKPVIGEHDADRFVPFLWTLFLFILFNNLLGLIPFCGSATGNIFVTLGLAICAFFAIHGSAAAKMGFGHYVTSMWPHLEVPLPIYIFIAPLVFVLEWIGVLVRNVVLAVRLFANMFAGHVVLATILIFIAVAVKSHPVLWGTVTFASVAGQVALSLLELFVAFLQAYIFTFLTSLFMGMAMHPAH